LAHEGGGLEWFKANIQSTLKLLFQQANILVPHGRTFGFTTIGISLVTRMVWASLTKILPFLLTLVARYVCVGGWCQKQSGQSCRVLATSIQIGGTVCRVCSCVCEMSNACSVSVWCAYRYLCISLIFVIRSSMFLFLLCGYRQSGANHNILCAGMLVCVCVCVCLSSR